MRHGSLFSGIGGFDLAAERMGWQNIFHCELNEFGQRVLKHYWPQAISYHDITKTDFTIHRGQIDILTGGFPCQPYSLAGKRKGKEDERHLWPEMLRAIREIKPTWVVGENVFGLVNWSDGMVFEEVCTDLETEGYEVQPFILPAAGVNAPHKRDRVWFVGYSEHNGRAAAKARRNDKKSSLTTRKNEIREFAEPGCMQPVPGITADTKAIGMERNGPHWKQKPPAQIGQGLSGCNGSGNYWNEWPTQPPVCSGNDGVSTNLDGITFSKWRNESIKAAGNAIVPQVALQIFKAINDYDNYTS